jgi:hypothetical protein
MSAYKVNDNYGDLGSVGAGFGETAPTGLHPRDFPNKLLRGGYRCLQPRYVFLHKEENAGQ